jgi:hypothetical protein
VPGQGDKASGGGGSVASERTVEEVLNDHLSQRERGDLEEDLRRNYHEDVVILSPTGSRSGHDGVRESAKLLYKALRDQNDFEYSSIVCDDRVALLEWSARGDEMDISDGVDTFLIEDGSIRVQTIRYSVTFSDISQAHGVA